MSHLDTRLVSVLPFLRFFTVGSQRYYQGRYSIEYNVEFREAIFVYGDRGRTGGGFDGGDSDQGGEGRQESAPTTQRGRGAGIGSGRCGAVIEARGLVLVVEVCHGTADSFFQLEAESATHSQTMCMSIDDQIRLLD